MDITTEAGALFDNHPRVKNRALLLGITMVNPYAGSNLGNAARHVGKHLADAVERKKNKYRGSFPATYHTFLSLCRHVVMLAQTCMASSRSSPSDGYSTGWRHTPMSPNIWRKGRSSTSSAAILFCFTAGTLIPHASPSLQTGSGACEHPTAPFARPGIGTSASYWGGNRVRGIGRSEQGRGRDWSRE